MSGWILLLFIYIIWGTTYTAIAAALESFPPFLMAALRYTISGLLLLPWWLRETGSWRAIRIQSLAGVGLSLGNALVVWSQQSMPSGYAALYISSVPLWMVVMNWLFFDRQRPNARLLSGIAAGMTGVFLLSLLKSRESFALQSSSLTLVLAALIWSFGTLTVRRSSARMSLIPAICVQSLAGGLFLFVPATFAGEWASWSEKTSTVAGIGSFVYLIVFGTILAMNAYNRLLQIYPPSLVGTYALVNPLVALGLGAVLLNEAVRLDTLASGLLILLGVGLMLFEARSARRTAAAA